MPGSPKKRAALIAEALRKGKEPPKPVASGILVKDLLPEENCRTLAEIAFNKRVLMKQTGSKYKTAEEMMHAISRYGIWSKTFNRGKVSLSGCALFLGYASRDVFYRLEQHSEFGVAVQYAKSLVTNFYEESDGMPAKDIFMLKNLGFKDTQHHVNQNITVTFGDEDLPQTEDQTHIDLE